MSGTGIWLVSLRRRQQLRLRRGRQQEADLPSLSENSLEEGLAESRLHQQVMVSLVIGSSLGQLGTGQLGRS
jgi:hypothetical protein